MLIQKPRGKHQRVSFTLENYIERSLPALYMQINPIVMSFSYVKKVTRTSSFSANIEEYWGDELDTITSNGSTGAFILSDFRDSTGLTNLKKSKTGSVYTFKKLVDLYRNNGCIFDSLGRVIHEGVVIMNYDEGVYTGIFEGFNVNENAENPFLYKFDFTFKVIETVITA